MASARSDTLETYRAKRDFGRTSEPAGTVRVAPRTRRRRAAPRFVVQEHAARTLHWDLRLEHEGVLLSWAVPKGVPLDPGTNRLAVRTEDHPLEYLDFAGEIPAGSYGAGTMRIWDHGTYELEELALEDGKVHIAFEGERLHGRYMLVRTSHDDEREQWLLRRLDPADDPDRVPMPESVTPMLAKLADLPPEDQQDSWGFEVKWDGIRAVVFAQGGRIRITTRTGNDVTDHYPELAALGRALGSRDAVLDGEIVAFDDDGRPSFQRLQSRLGLTSRTTIAARAARTPVRYCAFDLLHLDGRDLRALPYVERRAQLRELVDDAAYWQVPRHYVGDGTALLDAVVDQGLEGIVAKRLTSPYREGSRGRDWLKIKQQQRQEFVICGWTEGDGRRAGSIGALLLAYHDQEGRLRYAGGVGTGFSDATLTDLADRLGPLEQRTSPLEVGGPDPARPGKWQAMRGRTRRAAVHHVRPELVCEVEFTEFTRDGTLRHPSFKGLRTDKDPRDVVREDVR